MPPRMAAWRRKRLLHERVHAGAAEDAFFNELLIVSDQRQSRFQKLDDGRVAMNSDLALKADELDPVIDQLLAHHIVFQAEHQHFYDFSPLVWFIHFRKAGDPLEIAHGVKAALNVTSTPFPQTLPSNPTTPLPADELGEILGASPTIGSDGVVNFNVPREDPIILEDIRINPYLNVASPIAFQPYGGDQNAAAVVDFGLVASEINDVMKVMRERNSTIRTRSLRLSH